MATSVPQRVCASCKQLSPKTDPACAHCGTTFRSDMRWKIPLIVLLFVLAFVVSIWLQSV